MAYHDDRCDECGAKAVHISPMYCLCSKCMDPDGETDDNWDNDLEDENDE